MPLVIIVIILVAVTVISKDFIKDQQRQKENLREQLKKTNARLERKLVDVYMKEGHSFDEAYRMAVSEIVSRGFVPCIPKSAYKHNSSILDRKEAIEYDSYATKKRKEAYIEHHNFPYLPTDAQVEEMDRWVYGDFPTNERELHRDIDMAAFQRKVCEVGEFIVHPEHGTCEIIDVKHAKDWTGALYTVKVIKTGEVAYIQALDPSIKKL